MRIKLPLGTCRKSHPYKVLQVTTNDFKIITPMVQVEYDLESKLPTGLLYAIDLYGNNIGFHASKLVHTVAVCATEVKKKGNTFYVIHPPHVKTVKGELIVEVTTIVNNKEAAWGKCWKYENNFSI